MKKPVKKYEEVNTKLKMMNSEAEEKFYMCEKIDAYVARPEKQEIEELKTQIN